MPTSRVVIVIFIVGYFLTKITLNFARLLWKKTTKLKLRWQYSRVPLYFISQMRMVVVPTLQSYV